MLIKKYIGIPFVEKGRTLEKGFDCWGLVRYVYNEELGIELPIYLDCYEKTTDRHSISERMAEDREYWTEIKRGLRKEFDVVLMNRLGCAMHVGVLVGQNDILHTEYNKSSPFSRCVSIFHPSVSQSIVGFFRHADSITAKSILL